MFFGEFQRNDIFLEREPNKYAVPLELAKILCLSSIEIPLLAGLKSHFYS